MKKGNSTFRSLRHDGSQPSVRMFAQFGWAPSDRNIENRYILLGAVYTGLWKASHAVGLGISRI